MKKYSLLLLSVALLAGCANSSNKQSSQKTQTSSTVQLSKADQKTLDNATAEYKDFVEMQIDQLLKDTEGFRATLKDGNLEEAKKLMNVPNRLLKPSGNRMSKSTTVWWIMWMKINQKMAGQVSTGLNVSFGKTILQMGQTNTLTNW